MPTPSILCGPGCPPRRTADSAGSTATISTPGLWRFSTVATPRSEAAVPTQCTKACVHPSVRLWPGRASGVSDSGSSVDSAHPANASYRPSETTRGPMTRKLRCASQPAMLRCGTVQVSTAVTRALFVVLVIVGTAQAALSQPTGTGPVVGGTFSADADTHWSLAGFGRLSLHTGVLARSRVDLVSIEPRTPTFGPPYYASALGNPSRDLVSFTTNVRADLHHFRRVVPLVIVGGGVAADSVAHDIGGASAQHSFRFVDAETFLELVVGAGASVLVTQRVSIDGELKLFYMRGHSGQWARAGVGASYRF